MKGRVADGIACVSRSTVYERLCHVQADFERARKGRVAVYVFGMYVGSLRCEKSDVSGIFMFDGLSQRSNAFFIAPVDVGSA